MKKWMIIGLLVLPAMGMAQNETQMQMQKMMQQVQHAQMCMEKIDRKALEAMGRQAKDMEAEIKALCTSGKHDEAQGRGLKYALQMSQSDVAKQVRNCSEMMTGMMSEMIPGMGLPTVKEMEDKHICDAY